MEVPIGFITLYEAVDAVGSAEFGLKWEHVVQLDKPISGAYGKAITMIAEGCEDGRIAASYRSIMGVDELDRAVWRAGRWWTYFITGTIDLDLPLLDEKGRPNPYGHTARCTREIFIRRDSLNRFIAGLGVSPRSEAVLGLASEATVRIEIRAVYLEMIADPPNINTLPKIVRPRLNSVGVDASDRQIKKVGEESEFVALRRPVGKRR